MKIYTVDDKYISGYDIIDIENEKYSSYDIRNPSPHLYIYNDTLIDENDEFVYAIKGVPLSDSKNYLVKEWKKHIQDNTIIRECIESFIDDTIDLSDLFPYSPDMYPPEIDTNYDNEYYLYNECTYVLSVFKILYTLSKCGYHSNYTDNTCKVDIELYDYIHNRCKIPLYTIDDNVFIDINGNIYGTLDSKYLSYLNIHGMHTKTIDIVSSFYDITIIQ